MDWRNGLKRALGPLAVISAAAALVLALVVSPREIVLGDTVRILYVHVGAAWVAYVAYALTAVGAVLFLKTRKRRWDRLAAAGAEVGLVLTTVTLASGMIWGRAAQGWWWQWSDRRLTLTLFLWLLYAAYVIARRTLDGPNRAAVTAVLALVGIPAMVLNHFATLLFRGYHPDPVVGRPDGAAADVPFLWALGVSMTAYMLVFAWMVVEREALESDLDRLAELGGGDDV